ncbi:hypothetical protein SUGI_0551600 [Cryptomeria japonica]|nr:hypothetical protein SUGI_0551600 [Cryptomeria japonica]
MIYKPNLEYQSRTRLRRNKNKSCYYSGDDDDDEIVSGIDNGSFDKDWAFIAIKDDSLEPFIETTHIEEKALASKIEEKDEWVIDTSCSHHMTRDKRNFLTLQEFDGGLVKFGDNKACKIKGKGRISLDSNTTNNNAYYAEGLNHNLLSVGQIVDRGFLLQVKDGKCKIIKKFGLEISFGTQTKENIFHLNSNEKACLIAQIDEI